jgi:hypothetical protein
MDAAIREGEPLPGPGIAVMIAGVIVICGLITTALLLGTTPWTRSMISCVARAC